VCGDVSLPLSLSLGLCTLRYGTVLQSRITVSYSVPATGQAGQANLRNYGSTQYPVPGTQYLLPSPFPHMEYLYLLRAPYRLKRCGAPLLGIAPLILHATHTFFKVGGLTISKVIYPVRVPSLDMNPGSKIQDLKGPIKI
jgi:hypothetical protein